MMIRIRFVLLLMNVMAGLMAQDLPPVTQQQLESITEATDNDNRDDDFLQHLEYFRKHPLDLNRTTAEELQALRLLSDLQIGNLIRYRNVLGDLIDLYELQALPAWDIVTISRILPFVCIKSTVTTKDDFVSRFRGGDNSMLFRISRVLEKAKGYHVNIGNHYLGDRNHLMLRYRYQHRDLLYFGLTADKDAGEAFLKGAQSKGFDFYSFHFFARKLGMFRSIAIGDFTVNLGQGLIQWQSLAFGKSAEAMSVKRQSPVLIPYRSAGEFYFNRGVGFTLEKEKVQLTVFASCKKVSGNIVSDTAVHFTSLLTSGYYRTASEIADKNRITLASCGGNVRYQSPSLKIGLNVVTHHFNIPFQKRAEPYNLFALSGKKVFNSSVDYSYTFRNIHLFGEAAVDRHLHRAFINGAMISVDPKVDLSFLYRNIQRQFQSLFGSAFTENTAPVNEKGFYSGVSIRPAAGWQLNAYADIFSFPWIKYLVNAPSRGYEYLVQLNHQPNKQFGLYVRFRSRSRAMDGTGNSAISYPENQLKQNLRLHLHQRLSPGLSIATRFEILWLNQQSTNEEEGFLGYVEGNYEKNGLGAGCRLAYFETKSYDSRIYTYESDVLYSSSIPAFYEKGLRYYFNLKSRLTRKIQCWVRFAQTVYNDKEKIGSGSDEINGNRKSDLRIQFQYIL